MQFLEHCEAGIWGSRFGMDEPPLAQADTCSGKLLEAATPCCEADRTEEKKETNLIPNPTPPPPPPPLLPPTFKEATTAAAENEKHDEPPLLFSLSLSLPPLPLQSSPPSAPSPPLHHSSHRRAPPTQGTALSPTDAARHSPSLTLQTGRSRSIRSRPGGAMAASGLPDARRRRAGLRWERRTEGAAAVCFSLGTPLFRCSNRPCRCR